MFETLKKYVKNTQLSYTLSKLSNPDYIKFSKELQKEFDAEEKKQFPKIKFNHSANMTIIDDAVVSDKLDELYIVNYNNIAVGYVNIQQSSYYNNIAWLSDLYITHQHRGRGFGTEIITHMKQIVIEKGFDYFGVRFSGSKRKKFYERNGFSTNMSSVNVMEL